MKVHRGVLTVLVAAALAAAPLATAGAQTTPTTAEPVTEGSIPPGGTLFCEGAPTLDPDHGPPGTLVTVTAEFFGNCDQFLVTDWPNDCIGEVTGEGLEGFSFPMLPGGGKGQPELVGTFTAPVTEPNPPVQNAIEPLTVTVTCEFAPVDLSPEGEGTTIYEFPPATYSLELFADPDSEQPTFVANDDIVGPGVVSATPTFTG